MDAKIAQVKINRTTGKSTINVVYDNGQTEENLISYFCDEIDFTEQELIGKTRDEAKHLHFVKDKHYLQN